MRVERNSRKLPSCSKQAGWQLIGVTGDHHHFKHQVLKGKVTVPHPNSDIPIRTVRSVYRQAGWL
jgi:predicted RNA binding protein YcfA (HicA-like mRNA interferase family)